MKIVKKEVFTYGGDRCGEFPSILFYVFIISAKERDLRQDGRSLKKNVIFSGFLPFASNKKKLIVLG